MFKSILIFLVFISFGFQSVAQGDSLGLPIEKKSEYEHIPKRATLWALFPGAGQFYNEIGYRKIPQKKNRAWWKIPIVWGGLGATGYFWYDNFSNARILKEEIIYRREFGDSLVGNPDLIGYTSENDLINGYTDGSGVIQKGFDARAKNRDIFLFATIGVYGLQMIEAFVDAHFVTFDVSEDLSMGIYPTVFGRESFGMKLSFTFKSPVAPTTMLQPSFRF